MNRSDALSRAAILLDGAISASTIAAIIFKVKTVQLVSCHGIIERLMVRSSAATSS